MMDRVSQARRTWWERLGVFGPALLVTLIALVIAYQFVQPAPPRHITLAAGPEQGAYYHYGQIYRDRLADEGIDVSLRVTRGSVENVQLLKDHEVDVAFVQGGTGERIAAPHLRSLASLYFEPIWIFVRKEDGITGLRDLRGRRVAIDQEGSGTRAIALALLSDTGIGNDGVTTVPIGGDEAAKALRDGTVDAAFYVVAAGTPTIQGLLAAPELHLLSIERAAAYALQHRYLSRLVLPEGAVDLARNLPPADTTLLAPAVNLAVRDDFHPALSELLLRVGKKIFGDGGLFEEAGMFPSRKYLEYPIADQARRYFDNGPSLLQRYLPFWAANLVDRLKIMLLPLITLVYPLLKVIPPTYDWRMKSRINVWYKDLQAIERRVEAHPSTDELRRQIAELDRIEAAVQRLTMPVAYASPLYTLRDHIAFLRSELREACDNRRSDSAAQPGARPPNPASASR